MLLLWIIKLNPELLLKKKRISLIKLLDKREIINNFVFIDTQQYGKITEEETMERLSNNIAFCYN